MPWSRLRSYWRITGPQGYRGGLLQGHESFCPLPDLPRSSSGLCSCIRGTASDQRRRPGVELPGSRRVSGNITEGAAWFASTCRRYPRTRLTLGCQYHVICALINTGVWLTAWQVELVKDKATKEPFPAQDKIAPTIHAVGLNKFKISLIPGGGVADGTNGDVMVITPPFGITKAEAEDIVEKAAMAIEHVLPGTARPSKL